MHRAQAGSRRMPSSGATWLRPALLESRGVWRVVLMGIVAFTTVFWANAAFAQSPYPDGARNDSEWYYCYTYASNYGVSISLDEFSDLECLHLLWQESTGGGGIYESLVFEAETVANNTEVLDPFPVTQAMLQSYIVPARGIRDYTVACGAEVTTCRLSLVGERTARFQTHRAGAFSAMSLMSLLEPTTDVDSCLPASLNAVATHAAGSYDVFYSLAPVTDQMEDWATQNDYVKFRTSATVSGGQSVMTAESSCRIIAYSHWPQWLSDGNPPWAPAPGDLVIPTPTPFPSFGISLNVTPLAPISNVVDVVIGTPQAPECTTIIPSGGVSETVFGYVIDNAWADYEVCTQATDLHVEFFGMDFGGYLLLALGAASIGVVLRIFRTG